MRCIARAASYRSHRTNMFTRAVPYRHLAPDKHVHKSCAIQTPTGKHSTGIVDHTNQEYIFPGTDLDHGIGNRDLICLMCAKSKFPSGSFKLQNSAR